ncbi:nitrous oxide reductase accessory protein NosL [Natrialbaceae archaeon AArc-T1-2]|uniref:nitrous oxide reductase accessory protein NosL n=1 Tax=Natrialbaceae archaeon AArc-T1-2 TaxID=3053904 RepID=UPI00255AC10C|nr:nitrous oxide reductase accessory protein NosL [Natrialbaceae archaeon AArc-T1-2]WIV67750.1 nitrous oxide reductase accessory protein NosL [Natrialbaceae archaeon AArc-T1-2]
MREPDKLAVDRRRVLGAIGIGTAVGLAGCLGDDDEPEETDDEEVDDEAGDEEVDDEVTDDEETDDEDAEPALDEPAEFDGTECAVCGMAPAEHPDWNAQLVHETGTRAYFCSSGCMAAYYPDPLEFGDCEAPIENVWVTCFGGELVDGAEAYYVRVTDPDHVDDIMMINPTPFAEREDAEGFVDDFEEYDDEDIITLEDFDEDLAMTYREDHFED